jgi:hypothetical protein
METKVAFPKHGDRFIPQNFEPVPAYLILDSCS